MQVVNVTQEAIDLTHPREVFFRMFPREVECGTCKSKMILDGPSDVRYKYRNEEYIYGEWLMWRCAACGENNNDLHATATEIAGYREYFPKDVFWKQNGAPLAFLVFFILFSMILWTTVSVA